MEARLAPQLTLAQIPMSGALYAVLSLETRGRGRFSTDSEADLYSAAETLVRYRLGLQTAIRQADRNARCVFFSYLWGLGRRSSPEMQLTMQILARFAPQVVKVRPNANGPLPKRQYSRNGPGDILLTSHISWPT